MRSPKTNPRHRFRPSRRLLFALAAVAVCLAVVAYVRLRPVLLTRNLVQAIQRGDAAAVNKALQRGADRNAWFTTGTHNNGLSEDDVLKVFTGWRPRELHRSTPLTYAARENQSQIVRILVAQGADVNARERDGTTALMEAAHHGDMELARLLLAHGANPNAHWKDGETVLEAAWRSPKIASMLKKAGAAERK